MKRRVKLAVVMTAMTLLAGLGWQRALCGAEPAAQAPTAIKPLQEPADSIMGQYEGKFTPTEGSPVKAEAQVIGLGIPKGKTAPSYRAVVSTIAAGAGQAALKVELRGELAEGASITGKAKKTEWTGKLEKGILVVEAKGNEGGKFELKRVERHSPTEGQKSPAGAVVLLPYEPGKPTNLNQWRNKNWQIVDDGSALVKGGNNLTVKEFGDMKLHVEFRIPYLPEASDQGRGNSGVYSQNRYEVQILDSFGLPPKDNECGGIYEVAPPKGNACFPPGAWQTYDIAFRTHRFDADGKVIAPATLTVYHNGVLIHDKQPVMNATRAAGASGAVKAGPLMLQDHGNPVRYRNIWLVELKDEERKPE